MISRVIKLVIPLSRAVSVGLELGYNFGDSTTALCTNHH